MLRLLLLGTALSALTMTAASAQTLSQVGDQAAKDVAKNRREAAETLDKGVRGQLDAKQIRGLSEPGSPADIVAKMGVDPNSEQGQAYITVLEAQRASLGTAPDIDMKCMPGAVNNDSGMAQGEVFIQQYLAALSAGNAQGIKDAVRRGQDNTALMNHVTASTPGTDCASKTTKTNTGERRSAGAKVINVQGGAGAEKSDAMIRADAERRFAKAERLREALVQDPANEAKREAVKAALREANDYYIGTGLGPDEYEKRLAQFMETSKALALEEGERRLQAIWHQWSDLISDPASMPKQAALEDALYPVEDYYIKSGLGEEAFQERMEKFAEDSEDYINEVADNRVRSLTETLASIERDPDNKVLRNYLIEHLNETQDYYDAAGLGQKSLEDKLAKSGLSSSKIASDEGNRLLEDLDDLRYETVMHPERQDKQEALQDALDNLRGYYLTNNLGEKAYQDRIAEYKAENQRRVAEQGEIRFSVAEHMREYARERPNDANAQAMAAQSLSDAHSYYSRSSLGEDAYFARLEQFQTPSQTSEAIADATSPKDMGQRTP
ncbi:hypothetical protein P6144_02135 [Sphingomonas sp. HITSZ_GF]|uniref:hypothetical protein n=1 Tax=Sphingomonas sp. HITSZ_GF TaxID=3037247 RepID=UPI00240CFEAC|nr:hypothetical protein [Sphingomonas sp. HITSZ_GF]MDG2532432.1 hypothetical protein [Sphingomonas sp. HITSZ_GF]